ncbi:DNA polymerase IV [Shewanella sp. NFH-SH190041]|uniref:DNA polymerase IV n=1 Tax=Shewanella sp. NFH-SH190041 TaxID=2950245 RepID=UPI0021C4130B|nr:DNA polymerase IV [Shewanella sp. NFH-SH190041]BDM63360.1 DNA polymerase IV [Shewanella sp. NFH-SH190041]
MQKIIHVDMDCYYAAVEMRDNPDLWGKPLAVGGRRERRGVISTCNYEARRFGVRSAMASAYALRLCPDLILVPGRMDVYKQVSAQIRAIFQRYTSLIEPLSLDEAYLDVTQCQFHQGSATRIAAAIRADILAETGLTASAGIAPVKFLAKVASDLNKPNGQYVIPPDAVAQFVKTLPLGKIPGVGRVTGEKLAAMGLHNCEDVQQVDRIMLLNRFGKFGELLWQRAHGVDPRSVSPDRIRKSVGVETTLAQDISTLAQAGRVMDKLIPELSARMAKGASGRQIHKQVVKLKFDDFKQTTIEQRSDMLSVSLFQTLLSQAMQRADGRGIRLVGISVGLADTPGQGEEQGMQLDLAL